MDISINKFISESGFCSRREADKLIEQGRVDINKNVAQKGNRVTSTDVVYVDGERIKSKTNATTVYLAFNKPKGVTCTTDLKDKTNIIDFIRYPSRIFPIGRLDKLSDGLIFLTNDGDVVNKILRAGNQHEKEYVVVVDKPVTFSFIQKMRAGVRILDTITMPCSLSQLSENKFRIVLKQGLNRQIRRMCEALGYKVQTLTRVRIMHISLKGIAPGKWRHFTKDEMEYLQELIADSSGQQESRSSMDE